MTSEYPTCSYIDCTNPPENYDTGLCATHGRLARKLAEQSLKPPKTKKPIAKNSDKMAQALKEYAKLRKEFLKANPVCEVFKDRPAVDIHHMKGRATIELLLDDNYWKAVSREAHQWIELHPEEAKEKGYSLSRLASTEPI